VEQPADYRTDGPIVTITLNNPDRRNGLSPDMVDALVAMLVRLQEDPQARCAILTGAGAVFCAGGDPRRMLEPGLYPDMSTEQIRRFYQTGIQRLPTAFLALDVPIIAAVNGPAVGAGCDLACWCDMRIASSAATFASSFVKLGLVPGDGGAWLMPRIVGSANAAQMLLTGDTFDAVAAQRMGLVSEVVSPEALMEQAVQRAARIAANPPHAVRLTKRLLVEGRNLSAAAALELSACMQAMCHKTADHREAVTARLEKRPANFTGK
jgi:enoyl-CoA hydratase/carnithine racemase